MGIASRFVRLAGTAVVRPFQFALYALSGLLPRRDDIWVFGSWGGWRFADNSRAFFLYCQEALAGQVRLVWISRDREIVADLRGQGFEAHWIWSLRGMWRCARAGLYVFDCFSKDINHWLSRGARNVDLWSGVPMKVFERDIDNPMNRYYRLFHGSPPERFLFGIMMPWHVRRPDLLIATSEETAAITQRAFDVPRDVVAVTGFPRNDALMSGERADRAGSRCPRSVLDAAASGAKVFLYLPTFRDSAKPFLDIDWNRVDAAMEEIDAVFFLKFHPVDATQFGHQSPRVVQLFQDVDVYDVLVHTTALISDYSSIIFDYMLLGKPIVYYMPDLREFVSSSRSLVFDPVEIAVGPICENEEQLLDALTTIAHDGDAGEDWDHRARVTARLHDHLDGGSNDRVLDAIDRELLGGRLRSEGPTR